MAENKIKYDVEGYDVLTSALLELLNSYPGKEEDIGFSTLSEDGGIAMFPVSGAVVETETEDVVGNINQVCLYPFFVIYRASGLSENSKVAAKEWLDNLGAWLEKQPVTINGSEYWLDEYPPLTKGRKILSVERQSPGYLDKTNENGAEDWAIYISARYENVLEV